jgi:putative tryptophan/tyrosine transport system substrate-binding protein
MPVIGYLDFYAPQVKSPRLEGLRAGLADTGFVEGENFAIEYRSGKSRLLPSLVADLLSHQVAVILAVGALGTVLARDERFFLPFTGAAGCHFLRCVAHKPIGLT